MNLDHNMKENLWSAAIRKKKFKFIWGQDKLLKKPVCDSEYVSHVFYY